MAMDYEENVKLEAEAIAAVCNEMVSLYHRANQLLEHNSDLGVDWANAVPPVIEESGSGNLLGLAFTKTAVANAVNALDQFRKYMTNQAVTTGDYLGSLDLVSRPLG